VANAAVARPAEEVTERAQELHRDSIVIDACSFFLKGYNERIREGGVTAINFTVPLPMDDYPQAVIRIKEYYEIARRDPKVEIAWSAADVERCKREEKLGAIIGCQSSRFLGTDLGLVEVFWRLGLRVVQLTYNERNFAGDGCLEPENAGVSFFGRNLIKTLNRFGIVLDLSHCGIRSSLEALEITERPAIMSHVGIRARVDSPRAVSDEQLAAVARTGGVVGVTSHPNFNWLGGPNRPHLNDFLDGIEHAIQVVGVDHVGIGTDYVIEPSGYPEWVKRYLASQYDPYSSGKTHLGHGVRATMPGLDPRDDQLEGFTGTQHLPRVTQGLLDRGYPEADVRKILGGNFLRVFREVWRSEV
jgi:membrane dipeptidase